MITYLILLYLRFYIYNIFVITNRIILFLLYIMILQILNKIPINHVVMVSMFNIDIYTSIPSKVQEFSMTALPLHIILSVYES